MTDVKQLITEHLDIWLTAEAVKKSGRGRSSGSSDTIYGVQKLRELILDLAVRGKLNKRTQFKAPDLLEAIEKIQKENNIKLKNSSVSNEQFVGDFPTNWLTVQIKTLGNVKGGKRVPKGQTFSEKVTPYIYLRVTDMKNHTIVDHDLKYITEETFKEISRYTISKHDVYVTIAGTIGAVGVVPEHLDGMSLTENAAKITNLNLIHQPWLVRVLSSKFVQAQFADAVNQMAQPKLAINKVEDTYIPLPPLEEQIKIAQKTDELMQLCDQLEEQQNLNSEAHAILVDTLLKALTESCDAEEFQANWQRIVANFDLLFTTDYSIEQLKQSILQLAVMGKLVKQDPSDEPASELLKQIAEEKAKLIKEGKIKKSKPLPEISEAEKPFELPNGWELSRWENITYKIGDIDHKMPKAEKDGYPFVSPRDFYGQFIDFDNAKKISKEDFDYLSKKISPSRGDLIYPRYGTIGENVLVNTEQKFVVSYSCAVVKTITKYIDPNFQFLYSMSNACKIQAIKATNKTTQPNVGIKSIQEYIFAVPPLNEQKRIVEKVNQLFSMIEQLQALQSKLQKTKLQLADALVANAVEGV